MSRTWVISLVSAVLATLFLATTAFAGGGGFTVVYSQGPAWIVVGQPTVIRFHVDSACSGLPESGLGPQLVMTNLTLGSQFKAHAADLPTDGDYEAIVTFPVAGQWSWRLVDDDYYPGQTDQLVNVVTAPVALTKIENLRPLLRALIELRIIVAPMSLYLAS